MVQNERKGKEKLVPFFGVHRVIHVQTLTTKLIPGFNLSTKTVGAHVCHATSKENVTFHVMGVTAATTSAGNRKTLCTVATVEKHTSCTCSCKQKKGRQIIITVRI